MFDLLIKGSIVVDGTGAAPVTADVGVRDGRITEVGRISADARRTIDADGLHLLPGFVDIHTHYDGQASWDETFSPSIYHGVTTLVMGNCGVGFAPVQPGEEQRLVNLMEGVEEIPGAALAEGVRWGWRSFADYARQLDAMPHTLDFMTLVPHDCLRLYVMGDRAARGEAATADDCMRMQQLLREALLAGAAGFSTGRSDNHRTAAGEKTPAWNAGRAELVSLAGTLRGLPYRVLHAVNDYACNAGAPDDQRARFENEYALMEAMGEAAGRPLALTWLERVNAPQQWHWLADAVRHSEARGIKMRLQAATRAIGLMNGLDTSFNILMAFPGYQAIAHLSPAERAQRMRAPELRTRILAEAPVKMSGDGSPIPPLADYLLANLDQAAALMFPLRCKPAADGSPASVDYEPDPRTSFAAKAKQRGISARAAIYDYLAEGDGNQLVYFPIFNYLNGSLDAVQRMLDHPQALVALGDAGAHVGTVCDASYSTTLLTHWVRDRQRGTRLPLERAVHMLSQRNAWHMGLRDRGAIAVGMRADINLIDLSRLALPLPELVRDLPAGGRRFVQKAQGYRATLVAGQTVCDQGEITAARPGRWLRGSSN